MPPVTAKAFSMPKSGNSEEEYEDAWASDETAGRFAVADGAAESIAASLWAKILVDSFLHAKQRGGFCSWFTAAQERWYSSIPWGQMAYYVENKAKKGSFAAFAGLCLPSAKSRKWCAVAVGDCCLFHVRGQELIRAFPISDAATFDNRPELLRSAGVVPIQAARKLKSTNGTWEPGDSMILATDKVAQWLLRSHGSSQPAWPEIQRMSSAEDFRTYVGELRRKGEIQNDDSTVVHLQLNYALADTRRL